MGRRRTGTVFLKDGHWWYAFLRRDGRRYTRRVPQLPDGRDPTEDHARVYLAETVRRYELGLWDPDAPVPEVAAPKRWRVGEWVTQWAAGLTHVSASNERDFARLRVAPTQLAARHLDETTPHDVAAWVRELRAMPARTGGTLAPNTVRGYVGFLKKAFAAAVFEGHLTASPVVLPRAVVPRGADKTPGARLEWRSTRDEVERFISSLDIPQERRTLYALLYLAGLRRGEAVALRWRDLDGRRTPLGCLRVARSWSRRDRVERGTKTGAVREVPVHPVLAAILAEWRLSGWPRQHGRPPTDDDLVVPSSSCPRIPRDGATIARQLLVDARTLGVTARRVHGTRHTFVSLAIDDGARPDVIAKITHTRPVRNAFDLYRSEAWSTLCAEVQRLRVERRPDVLPLFARSAAGTPDAG